MSTRSGKKVIRLLSHLAVFVVIEVIFVIVLFRELPTIDFISLLGILHTSYWIVVLAAGWLREQYAERVVSKALCTYIPLLYHVFIHIYAAWYAIHAHTDRGDEIIPDPEHLEELGIEIGEKMHVHSEHELVRIIIGAVLLGGLIFLGEYLLHRKLHCDSHHKSTHKHCHDKECTDDHDRQDNHDTQDDLNQ